MYAVRRLSPSSLCKSPPRNQGCCNWLSPQLPLLRNARTVLREPNVFRGSNFFIFLWLFIHRNPPTFELMDQGPIVFFFFSQTCLPRLLCTIPTLPS